MKRVLVGIIVCWPVLASAQSFVNPDTTEQPGDIYIQNTDVYYTPMAPPGDSDTRENLSNESAVFRDKNGVGDYWHVYLPVIFDTTHGVDTFAILSNWAPYGTPLGPYAHWQRFFTARRKWNGSTSDVIVGSNVAPPGIVITPGTPPDTSYYSHVPGPVIVSKNEDVDFRASGTVKMENGFHVMPGAFFHAYQEPHWDTAVFSDEFDDMAKFHNQWSVSNGFGDNYGNNIAECSSDSNVRDTLDPDAHDGHALDVILREVPDTCSCYDIKLIQNCVDSLDTRPDKKHNLAFLAALLHTCPFPYTIVDSQQIVAYAHAPYGKYEIREKIPHVKHHINNWCFGGAGLEYDMNEVWGGDMSQLHPGAGNPLWHGPYKGAFGRKSSLDTTRVFRSRAANWCLSNYPTALLFPGNFGYDVGLFTMTTADTSASGNFPYSYSHSTDSFTFYYHRLAVDTADNLLWKVTPDDSGHMRIFSAAYHIRNGSPLIFSKSYQPTSVTLHDSINSHGDTLIHTYTCHWVDSLNDPVNHGKIRLDSVLKSGALDSNTEAYQYTVSEGTYPNYPYPFDGDDTSGGYSYHTFAMEWLPNEVRILMDSNVVWRSPDRLIPPSSIYSSWASWLPRSPVGMNPAEVDMDLKATDSLGADTTTFFWRGDQYWNSITGHERQYFDHAASQPAWPGLETVGGKRVAHHMIDYVKVWDVPSDMKIPDFPK